MKKSKKLLPPNFLLIYLLLAITLHIVFPIRFILVGYYRLLGILFIVLGIIINIWADNIFKQEKTTVKPGEIPSALITYGPFHISRHPMYLGFVSILLGTSTVLGSISSFIAPILMFVTLRNIFILDEEKQMKKVFGKKYLEYQNQVRRWL